MKKRSNIDWTNPPEPSVYSAVTLGAIPKGPAVLSSVCLTVVAKPRSKKGVGIYLPALIYYCREAAIKFPVFREELLDMIAKLPLPPPPPHNSES